MAAAKPLQEIAHAGSRLRTLRALRDRLAEQIELCNSNRDLASLSKRLMDVMREIDEIKAERARNKQTAGKPTAKHPPTTLDVIAGRREARKRASSG